MSTIKKYFSLIYNKIRENPLLILVLIALFVRIYYAISVYNAQEIFPKTNDSYWYVEHANELINDFKVDVDFNGIFYISYYFLVALLIKIFNTDVAMVYFQVIVGALTVIPLYKTSELLNKRTAIIAALIFIFNRELKYWSTFILTDSLFITNLVLLIYSYTFLRKTQRRKYLYYTIANIIYMIFLRPAGTITVCFLILYILVINLKPILNYIITNKKTFLLLFVACLPYIVSVVYFTFKSSIGLSFYWNLRWLIFENYGAGQIFDIPTVYDHKFKVNYNNQYLNNFVLSFFINNFYHIFVIYVKRFIFLWGEFWIWSYHFYSFTYAIKYISRCLPLIFAILGMLRVLNKRKSSTSLVLFIPIISTVVFCVIFFLDSAWRYRLPSLPFLAIFIGFGIDNVLSFIISKGEFLYKRLNLKFNYKFTSHTISK